MYINYYKSISKLAGLQLLEIIYNSFMPFKTETHPQFYALKREWGMFIINKFKIKYTHPLVNFENYTILQNCNDFFETNEPNAYY